LLKNIKSKLLFCKKNWIDRCLFFKVHHQIQYQILPRNYFLQLSIEAGRCYSSLLLFPHLAKIVGSSIYFLISSFIIASIAVTIYYFIIFVRHLLEFLCDLIILHLIHLLSNFSVILILFSLTRYHILQEISQLYSHHKSLDYLP